MLSVTDGSRTKAAATKKANALLAKMTTAGWKISVHQSIDWFYNLRNRDLRVYPSVLGGKRVYYCKIGVDLDDEMALSPRHRRNYSRTDPNEAVKGCVERAQVLVAGYIDVVARAKAVVSSKKPPSKRKK